MFSPFVHSPHNIIPLPVPNQMTSKLVQFLSISQKNDLLLKNISKLIKIYFKIYLDFTPSIFCPPPRGHGRPVFAQKSDLVNILVLVPIWTFICSCISSLTIGTRLPVSHLALVGRGGSFVSRHLTTPANYSANSRWPTAPPANPTLTLSPTSSSLLLFFEETFENAHWRKVKQIQHLSSFPFVILILHFFSNWLKVGLSTRECRLCGKMTQIIL